MNRLHRATALALAAAAVSLAAAPSEAQRPPSPRPSAASPAARPAGSMSFFMIGAQRLDLDELDERMRAAGYPALDRDFLSIGGGGLAVRNRLLIGGEGHGLISPSTTALQDRFRTRITGGYGVFDLGYLLVTGATIDLYPVVGIGGGGLSIEIIERGPVSFDDVLRDPGRSTRLTSGVLVLDASLGLTYRTTTAARRARPGGTAGLALSIRGGYTLSPVRGEWQVDGVGDVAGAPDARLRGPYLRGSIGGWRRR
jgi:hypothetical protein